MYSHRQAIGNQQKSVLLCNVVCMCAVGDGRMGFTEEAPYDAIHVGAAAPTVPQAVCCFPITTTL